MFGVSLSKLVLLAAAIAAVWYVYRFMNRRDALRAERNAARAGAPDSKPAPKPVEDMARCAVCGTFVQATGPRSCGRSDCPYPG